MVREFTRYWKWRLAVLAAGATVHTAGEMFVGGVWQHMEPLDNPADPRLPNKFATRPWTSTKAVAIWFSSDRVGALADTPQELGAWLSSGGKESV
jgi:hypothetical protein